MKSKTQEPVVLIKDAAQMRDAFKSKLADAIAEHDLDGMAVYDGCVSYWTRKATFPRTTSADTPPIHWRDVPTANYEAENEMESLTL